MRHPLPSATTVVIPTIFVKKKSLIFFFFQAELEQQILFSKDAIRKFRRVLIKAIDNQTMRHTTDHENMVRSRFSIPVPPNLVPSYLPHCNMLDIMYTLKVRGANSIWGWSFYTTWLPHLKAKPT